MGSPISLWVLHPHAGPEPTRRWVTPSDGGAGGAGWSGVVVGGDDVVVDQVASVTESRSLRGCSTSATSSYWRRALGSRAVRMSPAGRLRWRAVRPAARAPATSRA